MSKLLELLMAGANFLDSSVVFFFFFFYSTGGVALNTFSPIVFVSIDIKAALCFICFTMA